MRSFAARRAANQAGYFSPASFSNWHELPFTSGAPEARLNACSSRADVASSAGAGGGGASGGGGTISILAMAGSWGSLQPTAPGGRAPRPTISELLPMGRGGVSRLRNNSFRDVTSG